MPAKRSKLTPSQRAKRAAKRARRAAAPPQPAASQSETLPATLERLGVRASLDLQGAPNGSCEAPRDGAGNEIPKEECCSQC